MAVDDTEKTARQESFLSPSAPTQIRFYEDAPAALDSLYQDCADASLSIDFEQYIFMDDEAGNRFLKLFIEKARAGLRVRLMLDGVGSRHLLANPLLRALEDAGGAVHFYNALGWRHWMAPHRWLPRNHNKVMLIDGHIAHVSSLGLWHFMRQWRELHVRMTGTLAQDIGAYFSRLWQNGGHRYRAAVAAGSDKNAPFRFIVSEPRFRRGLVYRELLLQIATAQRRVCFVTPYFQPPRLLRTALRKAARRGVEVIILTSARTDVPLADLVARSYFPRLLRHGVKIFLYTPETLHAKYGLIDDDWATIGSSNLDYLSLLRNREANIMIRDRDCIAKLDTIFSSSLSASRHATRDDWRRLPLLLRLVGYLGRALRKLF